MPEPNGLFFLPLALPLWLSLSCSASLALPLPLSGSLALWLCYSGSATRSLLCCALLLCSALLLCTLLCSLLLLCCCCCSAAAAAAAALLLLLLCSLLAALLSVQCSPRLQRGGGAQKNVSPEGVQTLCRLWGCPRFPFQCRRREKQKIKKLEKCSDSPVHASLPV